MVDNHVVCTTHQYLGLAVAVPVVAHSIVLLVRTTYHVGTQVDVPQAFALDVVAVQTVIGRVVGRRLLIRCVVTLQDELAHTIAINIGQRNIIDIVTVGYVSAATRIELLHGKLDVLLVQTSHSLALGLLLTFHHRGNLVFGAGLAIGIHIV